MGLAMRVRLKTAAYFLPNLESVQLPDGYNDIVAVMVMELTMLLEERSATTEGEWHVIKSLPVPDMYCAFQRDDFAPGDVLTALLKLYEGECARFQLVGRTVLAAHSQLAQQMKELGNNPGEGSRAEFPVVDLIDPPPPPFDGKIH